MKCCDMHAGKLNIPVEFQRKTRTANGSGGFTESWAVIAGMPTFAFVKALGGGERFASDRVEASTRFRLVVRYVSGLTEEDRVEIDSRIHNVKFINNVEFRNMWLEVDLDGGAAT